MTADKFIENVKQTINRADPNNLGPAIGRIQLLIGKFVVEGGMSEDDIMLHVLEQGRIDERYSTDVQ